MRLVTRNFFFSYKYSAYVKRLVADKATDDNFPVYFALLQAVTDRSVRILQSPELNAMQVSRSFYLFCTIDFDAKKNIIERENSSNNQH